MEQNLIECTCLIVGGGIAGVSCLETLSFLAPTAKIVLLTESPLIKAVTNISQVSKTLQKFDITEKEATSLSADTVLVIHDRLIRLETKSFKATTAKGVIIKYEHICLCTGARPKLISTDNPHVIGIRDTDSVIEFQKRIKTGKVMAIVGNGGIASEIVYEVKGIKIHWIVKDEHISSTFVDPGAAKFFQETLIESNATEKETHVIKRMRYEQTNKNNAPTKGAALGPDWHRSLELTGNNLQEQNKVEIHYNCEVKDIQMNESSSEFPVKLTLTNNEVVECDLVVSATGVVPCIDYEIDVPLKFGPDGGIFVDDLMQTSANNVYAAGDICYAGWKYAPQWFQMRLWTQARQMGGMAAKTIAGKLNNEPVIADFCFELFGHVTQLFGYQVILLGNFNGQGLGDNYEILLRVTPKKEYIKFVLKEGKLQGALLIGDTDLAETCENLILNQLDLTPYGDDILDPNIDIEDYFD
ncbi:pyridine nucleotide-disulfide oxidoreductase domain-containing protein 1 [Culicoides brevitarsis]|uniref:pyridine nucleotide-disulfide oxidoreductase domain-containing protein 1 n=1 Tax=Culicoides brevitarsis TaxID=469753 RepID=UPI00307BA5A7